MVRSEIDGWTTWQVTAYTGKNRNITLGDTWLRADSEAEAMRLGRTALRMVGIRGRFQVSARKYYPWRDIAFLGYIAQAPSEKQIDSSAPRFVTA